jgi:hypothetical protein
MNLGYNVWPKDCPPSLAKVFLTKTLMPEVTTFFQFFREKSELNVLPVTRIRERPIGHSLSPKHLESKARLEGQSTNEYSALQSR